MAKVLRLVVLAAFGGALAVATGGTATVMVMPLAGVIGPASSDFVERGLARAAADGVQLVVLQIDTPGGLDTSMREIIKAILASPVPVATFVAPSGARAASAGHLHPLREPHRRDGAGHQPRRRHADRRRHARRVAAVGAETREGAGEGATGDKPEAGDDAAALTRKQVHDAAAYIRGLAQLRGRNAEWGERAVREAVSLSADEALAQHVVDVEARDVTDLLAKLDGRKVTTAAAEVVLATRGAEVVTFAPDWRNRLLAVITNPSVALILMMIGVYGLFFEFSNPGFVLPGVVGAIALLLGLFALHMLPVNYAGLALLLLGIAFMVAEAFVASFGALGRRRHHRVRHRRRAADRHRRARLRHSVCPDRRRDRGDGALHLLRLRRRAQGASPPCRIRQRGTGRRRRARARRFRGRRLGARAQRAMAREERGAAEARAAGARHRTRRPRADGRAAGRADQRRIAMGLGLGVGGVVFLVLAVLVVSSFRVLREYERGVVFLLGRFWKVKGPGLILIIPAIQQMVRMDLRTIVLDVPPQDVITRDNVSVKVNAVVYFRVVDPEKSVIQVAQFLVATSQLAQTTLRAVLGKHALDELLSERERLNLDIQRVLDTQTDAWGIKVSLVEIKQVDLNESMIRAIARQAEAERERRAKIIHAEGELQASEKLLQAAQMLSRQPQAMQLRYLQTLGNIAGDKSSTIVFPIPVDLLSAMGAIKPVEPAK